MRIISLKLAEFQINAKRIPSSPFQLECDDDAFILFQNTFFLFSPFFVKFLFIQRNSIFYEQKTPRENYPARWHIKNGLAAFSCARERTKKKDLRVNCLKIEFFKTHLRFEIVFLSGTESGCEAFHQMARINFQGSSC